MMLPLRCQCLQYAGIAAHALRIDSTSKGHVPIAEQLSYCIPHLHYLDNLHCHSPLVCLHYSRGLGRMHSQPSSFFYRLSGTNVPEGLCNLAVLVVTIDKGLPVKAGGGAAFLHCHTGCKVQQDGRFLN